MTGFVCGCMDFCPCVVVRDSCLSPSVSKAQTERIK